MLHTSSRLWPTQVRWGTVGMRDSCWMRSTTSRVSSRVEPPAPYVTLTKLGWYGSSSRMVWYRAAAACSFLGGKNSKDRLGPAPDCNLSLRCTFSLLAWLYPDPHYGSMGIITGWGAAAGAGAADGAAPGSPSPIMFSCQLAGGTITSSPGLMGSLSLLSKSVLRFT